MIGSNEKVTAADKIIKCITDDNKVRVVTDPTDNNLIGVAGAQGFGVGICPEADLPTNMNPLTGYDDKANDNYGNYEYADGSIMVWIPKFYYRIADTTFDSVDVKGIDTFATMAQANANGYALHRVFIDGGVEKSGVFVDKYMISKKAWGTGYIGSSVKGGLPISSNSAHNQISDLTACAGNYFYEMIKAAHARDGINGAENASSVFFCCSRFIYAALAMLALAHVQASSATTYCAWYLTDKMYPKGCNNDALGDADDAGILYESDGYSNCGKTGSGTPFARTTHNGQECGVADLSGLMYEVSIGATCIAANKTVEDISRANPAQVTITAHGYLTGDTVQITSIEGGDWAGMDDNLYLITKVDADNFTLDSFDSSGYTLAYVPGTNHGTITKGTFYVAKSATAMKNFDSGNSTATDHWGATGVAAMMDALSAATVASMFKKNSAFTMRYGSGSNQVLDEALSGESWVKTGMGSVKSGAALDATGINAFGKDYYYQHIENDLCLLSCGSWAGTTAAGVWSLKRDYYRTYSGNNGGGRFACYPE